MDHTERFDSGEGPGEGAFARSGSGLELPAAPEDGADRSDPALPARPSLSSEAEPFDGFGGGEGYGSEAYSGSDGFGGPEDFDPFGTGPALAPPGPPADRGFDPFGTGAPGPAHDEDSAGGSFDAFAAGAVRRSGEGPALPVLRTPREASLFDAGAPVPSDPPGPRPVRAEPGSGNGGTRAQRVVTADYLLTINPVDGTEVTLCPPEERRTPTRRTRPDRTARMQLRPALAAARPARPRTAAAGAGRGARAAGPAARPRPFRPRHRPVRLGPHRLLETVANACAELAPEGVLRLSGYHRTPADLLQDLYAIVYAGDGYRPARAELPGTAARRRRRRRRRRPRVRRRRVWRNCSPRRPSARS